VPEDVLLKSQLALVLTLFDKLREKAVKPVQTISQLNDMIPNYMYQPDVARTMLGFAMFVFQAAADWLTVNNCIVLFCC
jgi:predicted YcjX-like family ATPase